MHGYTLALRARLEASVPIGRAEERDSWKTPSHAADEAEAVCSLVPGLEHEMHSAMSIMI